MSVLSQRAGMIRWPGYGKKAGKAGQAAKTASGSKKVNRSAWGNVLLFIFMLVISSFMALPMVFTIGSAFKPLDELWIFPPKLLPMNPTFKNFTDMVAIMSNSWVPFSRYAFNTTFITSVGTAGHILLASMCAYPLAKKKFPGKNLIFSMIVLSLMFNGTVTSIPNYITMSRLGWVDTYAAIIIPVFASPLGLYLMKQFMEQIPDALLESARMDGANQWKTFWHIVMPMVKSAWLTLLLLSVQSLWNLGNNNFIFSEELKTLSFALGQIMAGGIARAGVGSAVALFMMAVPVGVFIFTQNHIIETMSTSGMKE